MLSLLCAFLLVWCALIAWDYRMFTAQQYNEQALHSARALSKSLQNTTSEQAALAVKVAEDIYNQSRRDATLDGVGELLFILTDAATGQMVYASPALSGLVSWPHPVSGHDSVELLGRRYWSVQQTSAQWHLLVLEPEIRHTALLRWLGADQLMPMLVAFPFVLLPLCLAVWSGLRPLREFSRRVAARDPADVSALGFELRHAELKPLVTAFDQLLRKASQGIVRERAFVQDAAHELRTPLAVVTAQAYTVTTTRDPQAQNEAKQALERAIERASHLVHQLLSLARVDSTPRKKEIDVVEVTRQVMIAAAPVAEQRQIDIALTSADRLVAHVDLEGFFTIVDNLLRNALAYCPSGARVELTLTSSNQQVSIAVRDNGPGIPEADQAHLFDRFHRGSTAQSSGSGLGLAIVRQAAQAMGGEVDLEQGLDGRGAGFVVQIPCGASSRAALHVQG